MGNDITLLCGDQRKSLKQSRLVISFNITIVRDSTVGLILNFYSRFPPTATVSLNGRRILLFSLGACLQVTNKMRKRHGEVSFYYPFLQVSFYGYAMLLAEKARFWAWPLAFQFLVLNFYNSKDVVLPLCLHLHCCCLLCVEFYLTVWLALAWFLYVSFSAAASTCLDSLYFEIL